MALEEEGAIAEIVRTPVADHIVIPELHTQTLVLVDQELVVQEVVVIPQI